MSTVRQQQALCGDWSWAADPGGTGLEQEWFKGLPDSASPIPSPVPGAYPHASAAVWAQTSFTLDTAWQGAYSELCFEALGAPAQVWINGTRVGDSPGAWLPAEFVVGAQLRPGENTLVLCLRPSEMERPFIAAAHLQRMPAEHIESVTVLPDIRRKRIAVHADAPADATLRLRIEGTSFEIEGNAPDLLLDFSEFEVWTQESPVRYTLHVEILRDGTTIDQLSLPFAMREFSIKDARFHLNTHPFYVKGIWHRAVPARLLHGDAGQETARREVQAARDAGFNLIRFDGTAAPGPILDAADALGMLVMQPVESEAIVARDRNRSCIVAWTLPDTAPPEAAQAVRAADPSRVVLFRNAAGTGQFLRPYRGDAESYCDLRLPLAPPVGPNAERALRKCGSQTRLSFVSQVGSGTVDAPDNPTLTEGFQSRQLDRVFQSQEKFLEAARLLPCDAARLQLDAIRSNPRVSGYCFAQLHDDGPVPGGGLLDHEGMPKPGLAALGKIQLPVRPLIQMTHSNLVPRQEAKVTILLANEERLEGRADLSLQVVGPTNQVLWKKKRAVTLAKHGRPVWEGDIAASGSPGMHRFIVRLVQTGTVIAESSLSFLVAQPLEPAGIRVNLLDPHGVWAARCGEHIQPESITAPVHIVPPLGNTFRAYPDNDLMQILAQVHGGAVAIFFNPPKDWNTLAARLSEDLTATPAAAGVWDAVLHYARIHPVFEGLPGKSLMRQPYKNLVPPVVFEERSEEDIAGALVWRGSSAAQPATWASGILVRRYGSGLAVFTHMRVLEHLGNDMAADRLFANLLNHFSRRSVPSRVPLPVSKPAVEWLRRERVEHARRWMLLGALPNTDGAGHDKEYGPEKQLDLLQQFPGWHAPAAWSPGYALAEPDEDYRLAIDEMVSREYGARLQDCSRTAYAYAEFSMEQRQPAEITLTSGASLRAWLNGKPIYDNAQPSASATAPIYVRQGKNTLLVKLSQEAGPMNLAYCLTDEKARALPAAWWR